MRAWERIIAPGVPEFPMFAHAAVAGDYVYLSGLIGLDGTTLVDGVGAQTTQALANAQRVLAACHASLADVVKVTVFLTDMSAWQEMNDAYLSVIGPHTPARTSLGCTGLALGALVEIECVAYRPSV